MMFFSEEDIFFRLVRILLDDIPRQLQELIKGEFGGKVEYHMQTMQLLEMLS